MNEVKEMTDKVEVTVKGFKVEGFIYIVISETELVDDNEISRQRYKGGNDL
jgi:hypothetical protein